MENSSDRDPQPSPFDPSAAVPLAETQAVVGASPLTYEGIIEGYGKMAQVAKHGTGWRRIAGLVVFVAVAAPIVLGFVALVVSRF